MSEYSVDPRTRVGEPLVVESATHCCNDGWVAMGQVAYDEETGEEYIEYALYLCRRCEEA